MRQLFTNASSNKSKIYSAYILYTSQIYLTSYFLLPQNHRLEPRPFTLHHTHTVNTIRYITG